MPRAGFYNDNEYRQYPFVFAKPDSLPTDLIVDCGFIMGIDSGFDAAEHIVYLYRIRKTSTQIECEFRTTAPNAADSAIVFRRDFDAEEWSTEFASAAVANKPCAAEPLWEGFMVSGVMATTVNLLPINGSVNFVTTDFATASSSSSSSSSLPFVANRVVEPARVQSLVKTYLRSVSLGNYPRVIAPALCPGETGLPAPATDIIVNATCLKGDIRFKPGFNCAIRQYDYANRITIAAQKGANTVEGPTGELCQYGSEIKLYTGEQPPILNLATGERSKFLSGGPACDQVITGINGLGAPDVKIVGGAGIQVVVDQDTDHTIKLKIATNLLTENC
jgi:hypothetical protein